MRQLGDEIGCVGRCRRHFNARCIRLRVGVGNIGGDGGGKQHRVLRDKSNGTAAVGERHFCRIRAVNQDRPRLWCIKTGEQRSNGRFAAARLANQSHRFARLNMQVETG